MNVQHLLDDVLPARLQAAAVALIAGRHVAVPSLTELRIVHDALLAALDLHQTRVVTVIGDWVEHSNGDWNGYQIAYTMQSAADTFSPDPDRAQRVRLALEQRQRRIDARRDKAAQAGGKAKPKSTPKPML